MLLEKKRYLTFGFKFKKFNIKRAIFIIEINSIRVKVHTQKKIEGFFPLFLKSLTNVKTKRNILNFKIGIKIFYQFFFLSAAHSGIKKYKCEQCGMCFSWNDQLTQHIRLVHEGKKFSCEFCGSEYHSAKSLRNHKFKNHGVDKTRKYKYDDV